MIEMNEDGQVSDLKPWLGEKQLLIIGQGTVQILKSLNGKEFYPMTDLSGNIVTLTADDNDVVFNGSITNNHEKCRYQVKLISGLVKYEVA